MLSPKEKSVFVISFSVMKGFKMKKTNIKNYQKRKKISVQINPAVQACMQVHAHKHY